VHSLKEEFNNYKEKQLK
jgi:hypothetical protein